MTASRFRIAATSFFSVAPVNALLSRSYRKAVTCIGRVLLLAILLARLGDRRGRGRDCRNERGSAEHGGKDQISENVPSL